MEFEIHIPITEGEILIRRFKEKIAEIPIENAGMTHQPDCKSVIIAIKTGPHTRAIKCNLCGLRIVVPICVETAGQLYEYLRTLQGSRTQSPAQQ